MIIKEVIDSIKNIGIAVIIALLIVRFIGQTAIVDGDSMQTTLQGGNVLWIEKLTTTFAKLHKGDIVAIYSPQIHGTNYLLVKRIAAVEGDFIEIKDGKVFVNATALNETYTKGINTTTTPENPKFNALKVPAGMIYCLGDNRTDNIYDSRNLGLISLGDIRGRAIFRFWPLNKIGSIVR